MEPVQAYLNSLFNFDEASKLNDNTLNPTEVLPARDTVAPSALGNPHLNNHHGQQSANATHRQELLTPGPRSVTGEHLRPQDGDQAPRQHDPVQDTPLATKRTVFSLPSQNYISRWPQPTPVSARIDQSYPEELGTRNQSFGQPGHAQNRILTTMPAVDPGLSHANDQRWSRPPANATETRHPPGGRTCTGPVAARPRQHIPADLNASLLHDAHVTGRLPYLNEGETRPGLWGPITGTPFVPHQPVSMALSPIDNPAWRQRSTAATEMIDSNGGDVGFDFDHEYPRLGNRETQYGNFDRPTKSPYYLAPGSSQNDTSYQPHKINPYDPYHQQPYLPLKKSGMGQKIEKVVIPRLPVRESSENGGCSTLMPSSTPLPEAPRKRRRPPKEQAGNDDSQGQFAGRGNDRSNTQLVQVNAGPVTWDPTITSLDAAFQWLEKRETTYAPLLIERDNIGLVQARLDQLALNLFYALLHAYPQNATSFFQPKAYGSYTDWQETALKDCQKLMADEHFVTMASVHSMLTIKAIIDFHSKGVSFTELSAESIALVIEAQKGNKARKKGIKTKNDYLIDTSLKCLARANKIITHTRDYKIVAAELIQGKCSNDFILAPDKYIQMKVGNRYLNWKRGQKKAPGKQQKDDAGPAAADEADAEGITEEGTTQVAAVEEMAAENCSLKRATNTSKRKTGRYSNDEIDVDYSDNDLTSAKINTVSNSKSSGAQAGKKRRAPTSLQNGDTNKDEDDIGLPVSISNTSSAKQTKKPKSSLLSKANTGSSRPKAPKPVPRRMSSRLQNKDDRPPAERTRFRNQRK